MTDLDDLQSYKKHDPQGMLGHIRNLPGLCRQAWQMAESFELPAEYRQVYKVVVLGMGGSAIGGDLAAGLISDEAGIPIIVHRDYNLPAFVNEKTLVIASSYSGMTGETLSSFRQALDTDSKKLVITTGGILGELAKEHGIPVFSFDYKSQPRAALPFSFLAILCFIQKLGFIDDKSSDVAEMVGTLEQLAREINETIPVKQNQAKQLAESLYGKLAVIYGAGVTAAPAHRWKTQFNENGKAWAFHEVFPELNHNAVVGYRFPPQLAAKITVVMLRSGYLSEPILRRYQITGQLLDKAGIGYHLIDGAGKGKLAQMMSLVLFGDYVSLYLAMLNQIDPTPVEEIDFLKRELGKG
jgi:glucose/mannose-6-phosphate isomerase